MGFSCGIVGLPNAGKSTIFNALTRASVPAEKYPFCTIEPHIGVIEVPDERLKILAKITKPKKVTPATIKFVDIAGLVKGASKGEGLGNQFLSHIRNVDSIAHIVRCFTAEDVAHIYGEIDPLRDIEIVNTELILADLQVLEKRMTKLEKLLKSRGSDAEREIMVLKKVKEALERGVPLRKQTLMEDEKQHLEDLFLLTDKPVFYVVNAGEKEYFERDESIEKVKEFARKEGDDVVVICGKLEEELSQFPNHEAEEMRKGMGLEINGLAEMVRVGYRRLKLITFYTTVGVELRAWTILDGTTVLEAAGKIHSDMERGFICAEVINFDDFIKAGSEAAAREKGLLRTEGRGYVVRDGDIIHIKFSV